MMMTTIMKIIVVILLLLLSLRFNGHFPREPGLAGVHWSKGRWRWWWHLDYWSYKSSNAPVKSSPPTNQHPVFLQAGCPSCRPTKCQSTELKISHSMDLLIPSSPGGLPTLSLTINSSWLHWWRLLCLSSALWCQYPSNTTTNNNNTFYSTISRNIVHRMVVAWSMCSGIISERRWNRNWTEVKLYL